jgi:hypothetical protein
MANNLKKVVRQIADIATKSAQKAVPIRAGTVIARNPDGSLVVDDGRGGCLIQAPQANVRVGQKIVLGTEPALGQVTSLPEVDIAIDPSTLPCPGDGRPDCVPLIGAPCSTLVTGGDSADLAGTVFSIGWVSAVPTDSPPGSDGIWGDRLGSGGDFSGGPQSGLLFADSSKSAQIVASKRSGSYTNPPFGHPYANKVNLTAMRHFMEFDTSAVPSGQTITSAILRTTIKGDTSNRLEDDRGTSIIIVPSSHDGVSSHTFNWSTVTGVNVGSATLAAILAAGPFPLADTPYDYDITLDAGLMTGIVVPGGMTKLAVLMAADFDKLSATPTAPANFTSPGSPNQINQIADWILFNGGTDVQLILVWESGAAQDLN